MTALLSTQERRQAVDALVAAVDEALDVEIGVVAAEALLDAILEQVGPSVYNRGVRDAAARLASAVADLDMDLYRIPFPARRP